MSNDSIINKEEIIKMQKELEETMDKIHKEIIEERSKSPDGKTDLERKLSHMSVEDWFRPMTI